MSGGGWVEGGKSYFFIKPNFVINHSLAATFTKDWPKPEPGVVLTNSTGYPLKYCQWSPSK